MDKKMSSKERIDALPPGSELHSYVIEKVLGSGAFGITYLAEHRMLKTWHVIKEYLPDCGARELNRSTVSPKSAGDKDLFDWGLKNFYEEARLLHKLSHPHIVKVTDLFEANSTAYFVMPYLQGITLHEWMKKQPNPSQGKLEAIFVPLIEGLKYIHGKGLLHRDIKPENIYILDNSHPILIDFGSARIAIGQKSKALTQVLTPGFAPWEQYRTKGTFTPSLDLYSLAACMYMAITGEMPEEAPSRIEEDLQPRLAGSEYEKHYDSSFLQAIDKSLSVYAKDRHQEGFSFQQDLVGLSHVMLEEPEVLTQQVHQKIDHASTAANAPAGTNEQTPDYHPAHYKDSGERVVGWISLAITILILSGVFWPKISSVWQAPTLSPVTQPTTAQLPADTKTSPVPQQQEEAEVPKSTPPAVTKPDDTRAEPHTGMEFVWVPGGCFEMGCGDWDDECRTNELPVREICLDGFWIGKYEVTQGQWQKVMGSNPSNFKKGDNYPVEEVSWNDTQEYIRRLNSQSSASGFRLPTEAEWEYACRGGGRKEKYCGGNSAGRVAWYKDNSRGTTHPVGRKDPNALGIYDMSGNVWEWVSDWYDGNYYSVSPRDNPQGPETGSYRVYRGGSWFPLARFCRAAYRRYDGPGYWISIGFRLVLSPGQQ